MDNKWTRDHRTGETICAVCGAPKGTKKNCCKVAPFVSFDEFFKVYFPGATMIRAEAIDEDHYIPRALARNFYEDYSLSECASLQEYINQTTSSI